MITKPEMKGGKHIRYNELSKYMPHSFPFVIVDQAILFERNYYAVGYRAFGSGEYFFQGHFPGNAIVPGVIIIEGMAQTSYLAVCGALSLNEPSPVFITGIEKAKFKRKVDPSTTVEFHSISTRYPRNSSSIGMFKFDCIALDSHTKDTIASASISAITELDMVKIGYDLKSLSADGSHFGVFR